MSSSWLLGESARGANSYTRHCQEHSWILLLLLQAAVAGTGSGFLNETRISQQDLTVLARSGNPRGDPGTFAEIHGTELGLIKGASGPL